jgi:hypothetical protein
MMVDWRAEQTVASMVEMKASMMAVLKVEKMAALMVD